MPLFPFDNFVILTESHVLYDELKDHLSFREGRVVTGMNRRQPLQQLVHESRFVKGDQKTFDIEDFKKIAWKGRIAVDVFRQSWRSSCFAQVAGRR